MIIPFKRIFHIGLKIINPLLALSLLLQAFTGFRISWGYMAEWDFYLHSINGYVITALIILHVGFNFFWFKQQILAVKKLINDYKESKAT